MQITAASWFECYSCRGGGKQVNILSMESKREEKYMYVWINFISSIIENHQYHQIRLYKIKERKGRKDAYKFTINVLALISTGLSSHYTPHSYTLVNWLLPLQLADSSLPILVPVIKVNSCTPYSGKILRDILRNLTWVRNGRLALVHKYLSCYIYMQLETMILFLHWFYSGTS